MLALTVVMVRYSLWLVSIENQTSLETPNFLLLVVAIVLIAAGGYIINDIKDIETDRINKPSKCIVGISLSERKAFLFYSIVTVLGLLSASILCILAHKPFAILYFLLSVVLLYCYAVFFRKFALIGNAVVSFLVALSIVLTTLFALWATHSDGMALYDSLDVLLTMCLLAFFSFLINFIREIVKDIEDIKGDHSAGFKTLPIVLGIHRSALFSVVVTLVVVTSMSWFAFTYFRYEIIPLLGIFFGVILPLVYVCFLLWEAKQKKEFSKISLFLKFIMLSGIALIPIIIYNLFYA